jgi:hypothetical protein
LVAANFGGFFGELTGKFVAVGVSLNRWFDNPPPSAREKETMGKGRNGRFLRRGLPPKIEVVGFEPTVFQITRVLRPIEKDSADKGRHGAYVL